MKNDNANPDNGANESEVVEKQLNPEKEKETDEQAAAFSGQASGGGEPALQGTDEMSDMRTQIKQLREQLEEVEAQKQKQWDLAIRAKAETENVRRRAARDVEKAHKYGVEKMAEALLPVIDSLERGLNVSVKADDADNAMREGIELTLQMFHDVMKKFGIEVLTPVGEAFDPALHEALSMQESHDVKPGTVLQVIQNGYRIHERLLRPARVVVSRGAAPVINESA